MGKLIYSMLTTLDGYTEDEDGRGAACGLASGVKSAAILPA